MIETRAPGKLFIAGEYAVVEPGEPAVLIAVDRFLTVRLTESRDAGRVHSREYGQLPLVWTRSADGAAIIIEHQPYDYVMSAIAVVERLREERGRGPRYFDLHIESELDDARGRKFGLGSSAAVTVAVVEALSAFYDLALSRRERFQVALLATIQIAPTASGGDLAASTFGGWIRYTAPDRALLLDDLTRRGVSAALDSDGWAPFSAERLPDPSSLQLLVGWTGSPASTERLVDGVRHRRSSHAQPYDSFLSDSRTCVDALVASIERDDAPGAGRVVHDARRVLQRLGASAGISIETAELRELCDIAEQHGAAGKPSGAGGGDCGIVLADARTPLAPLLGDWETHSIRRLNVSVQPPKDTADAA